MQQILTGIGIKIQGHLKIVEYNNYRDYLGGRPNQTLLNKRNAVHKDHASVLLAKAITNKDLGSICYMVFGNGGTSLDSTGTVIFHPTNTTTANANLYNPTFFQMVDDTLGALPGNSMAVRHISNSLFSDVDIRCLIPPNQPFGQLASNMINGTNLDTSTFAFDEIGLKLIDGTLITHVTFTPVLKHAESLLEVIYTLRIFIAPEPPPPQINLDIIGVEADTQFTLPIKEYMFSGQGVEALAEISGPIFPFNIHGVRLNNGPYLTNMPQPMSLSDSPQGSLSMWVRGSDIFNMVHDNGPSLLSSGFKKSMNIMGRGYVKRQPTAISRTNPVQVTIPNHGLSTGDNVTFTIVTGGCSELQGQTDALTVVDSNNFTVPVDGTGFAAPYTGPAQLTFPTINKSPANSMRITFQDDDENPTSVFEWYGPEQIPADQWVNLLISWDMNHPSGNKVLQIYVNDTAWTSTSDSTYRYDPDPAFSVKYTQSPEWVIGYPAYPQTSIQISQVNREIMRNARPKAIIGNVVREVLYTRMP